MPKKTSNSFSFNTFLIIVLIAIIAVVIWCFTIKNNTVNNTQSLPVTHIERKTEHFESGHWVDTQKNLKVHRLCPQFGNVLISPEIHNDMNIKMKHNPKRVIRLIDAVTKCYEYDECEGFAATDIIEQTESAKVTFFGSGASLRMSDDPLNKIAYIKKDENKCDALKTNYYNIKTSPNTSDQTILDFDFKNNAVNLNKMQKICNGINECKGFNCKLQDGRCENPQLLSQTTDNSDPTVNLTTADYKEVTKQFTKNNYNNRKTFMELLPTQLSSIFNSLVTAETVPRKYRFDKGTMDEYGLPYNGKIPSRPCTTQHDTNCRITKEQLQKIGNYSQTSNNDDLVIIDKQGKAYIKQTPFCCNYSSNRKKGIRVLDRKMKVDGCHPNKNDSFFDEKCNAVCQNHIDTSKKHPIYRKDLKQCVAQEDKCFSTHESCNQYHSMNPGTSFKEQCAGSCESVCPDKSIYQPKFNPNRTDPNRNCVSDGMVFYTSIGTIDDYDNGSSNLAQYLGSKNVTAVSNNYFARKSDIHIIKGLKYIIDSNTNTSTFSATTHNLNEEIEKFELIKYFKDTQILNVFYKGTKLTYSLSSP